MAADKQATRSGAGGLEYVPVVKASDVPPGSVRMVRAGERAYALVNVEGQFYAVDNNCPHNGGPLGKGRLVNGTELECPRHQWRWDVTTGRATWPDSSWRVLRVPVRTEGDTLYLPLL